MWGTIVTGIGTAIGLYDKYKEVEDKYDDGSGGSGYPSLAHKLRAQNFEKWLKYKGVLKMKGKDYRTYSDGYLQSNFNNFKPERYSFGELKYMGSDKPQYRECLGLKSEVGNSGTSDGAIDNPGDVQNADWAIGWGNQTSGTNMVSLFGIGALIFAGYKLVKEMF